MGIGILAWVIVGLVAGFLASLVMRSGGYGIVGDIIIGMVGAVIGGFLAGTLLNIPDAMTGINITSIFVAFVGAVILIALLRLVSGNRGNARLTP
ncbi:MAG: GlsB/YeaQ/YmgE family stress response membrane protein [Caldilinea sp.]